MTKIQFFMVLMLAIFVAACGRAQPAATEVAPAPAATQSSPTQVEQAPSQVPPTTEPTVETAPQATATELEAVATATEIIVTEVAPPTVSTGPDGAALLQDRCTKCHSLDRVKAKSASADGWTTTVNRMVGKGAVLSEVEKLALIEYLSATYP